MNKVPDVKTHNLGNTLLTEITIEPEQDDSKNPIQDNITEKNMISTNTNFEAIIHAKTSKPKINFFRKVLNFIFDSNNLILLNIFTFLVCLVLFFYYISVVVSYFKDK